MATTTNLSTLRINYLTQAQFEAAVANNTIKADELYLTPAGNNITINLNGSDVNSPSFYAPTTSGTSGYILKSNGSGAAPSWIQTLPIANGGTGATTAASARANLGTWSLVSDSYNTLMPADGTTNGWVKIGTSNTSYGLLPSTSGGAGSGHNYIGTSSWYWKYAYIDQIYGYLNGNISGSASSATNAYNLLAYSSNETTIGANSATVGASTNDSVWFNYRDVMGGSTSNSATQITQYHFGNRKGSTAGVTVNAATFNGALTGNASTATKWASAQTVYVTLGTASTTTTLQGGSSSAQTIGVNGTLGISNGGTGATTAADALKNLLGTTAIGGTTKPIYWTGSAFAAISGSAGSAYVPVYLNAGTLTACSNPSMLTNLGSTTAASVFAASPRPGVTGVLGVANGGTGSSSFTALRAIYTESATKLSSSGHYMSSSKFAVNSTSEPGYNLYVNGSTMHNGDIYQTSLSGYRWREHFYEATAGTSALGTGTQTFTVKGGRWGEVWFEYPRLTTTYATAGDASSTATTATSGGIYYWRQWSYNSSTADKLSYYENFSLPTVTKDRTGNASYSILTTKNHAAPSLGTASQIAYYSAAGTISGSSGLRFYTGNSTAATPAAYTRLHIYGATYGNTAANMISGTAGLFSFGDGGPQITFDTNATPGGSQAGALIFTDHDTAATGASWHFVSNQTDWNVTSKRFHARTGISIGTNTPVTTDALYINGTTLTTNNISRTAASLGTSWVGSRDKAVINVDASDSTSSTAFSLARIKFSTKTYAIGSERAGNNFGIYGWNNSRTENGFDWAFYIANDTYFHCSTRVYGAVWNDYAEYRHATIQEPGRCVKEVGDDTLELSTARLQPGCEIVSDTFGFAIGETEKAKTPIATTGRVLAYPYENIEEFKKHIGEPVCSGPNGTVSIMTEEEWQKYPHCIIGTISAVPDYDTWGTENVKVNGRIWIRIK